MLGIALIMPLALAKELLQIPNAGGQMNFMGGVVDNLASKLIVDFTDELVEWRINELFDRALTISHHRHADVELGPRSKLDDTTLGKPGSPSTPSKVSLVSDVRPDLLPSAQAHWQDIYPERTTQTIDDEDAQIAFCVAEIAAHLDCPMKSHKFINQLSSEVKRHIGLGRAIQELRREFKKADRNSDGVLTVEEFTTWATTKLEKMGDRIPPSRMQLLYTFVRQIPPFVGFGFVDNSLMILSGDAINSFLAYFGISMMAAAALGNSFSDALGGVLHGVIERCANALGLPDPHLTNYQRKDRTVQITKTAGSVVGMLAGCFLGMFPLLFMDERS